jgi:hypothetical protein
VVLVRLIKVGLVETHNQYLTTEVQQVVVVQALPCLEVLTVAQVLPRLLLVHQ